MTGKTQLTLEGGSEAIVTKGGLQVTFNAAGGIAVSVNGKTIVVDQTGKVAVEAAPANDFLAQKVLEVGDEMEDGTIYAGISPDTGKPMYATPADASGVYDFNGAAKYAKTLEAHGYKDWRVPTKGELNLLYQDRDKGKVKGTFNETGSDLAGWYWSSSPRYSPSAWGQRFSDGTQDDHCRFFFSSLRCVR